MRRQRVTTAPEPGLLAAYLACHYRVFLPDGPLDLRVGAMSPGLDDWLEAQGAEKWALLTAHNPGSTPQTAEGNQQRQLALQRRLAEEGWVWLPGENLDPQGLWPAEASCLVAAMGADQARALALEFGQNAWLAGGRGEVARLCWRDNLALWPGT